MNIYTEVEIQLSQLLEFTQNLLVFIDLVGDEMQAPLIHGQGCHSENAASSYRNSTSSYRNPTSS